MKVRAGLPEVTVTFHQLSQRLLLFRHLQSQDHHMQYRQQGFLSPAHCWELYDKPFLGTYLCDIALLKFLPQPGKKTEHSSEPG